MTNITLFIEDSVYNKMRQHSDIKWSEYVRKVIKQRLEELETLEHRPESVMTMLASEHILQKEWENKADERWDTV